MSKLPDLTDHIPAFCAVMTQGSLSAAARALRLAQPTVRRHIELIEQKTGTALFTRAANGLTPTDTARNLLPLAEAVLAQSRALARAARAGQNRIEGPVRITCSRIVAQHILPPLLVQIQADAPDLRFEVAATDTAENLGQRAADVAIRFVAPRQLALRAVKLPDVEIGLFATPALAARIGGQVLEQMPLVTDDRTDVIVPALAQSGFGTPRHVVLRCDDPLAQIAAVQAGLGAGVCQVKLAARLGLVRLAPQLRHFMPAWLVIHEDQARILPIRHVFDQLKTALPKVM